MMRGTASGVRYAPGANGSTLNESAEGVHTNGNGKTAVTAN